MSSFWITTSWDDGHPLDRRLADLLDRYHLKGTFYISKESDQDRLSESEIIALSERHEIGAHTLSHVGLTGLDDSTLQYEVAGSRAWLQLLTGQPITAFCYPRGQWDAAAREAVARAGFMLARTVEQYRLDVGDNPWLMPTTVHIYPFPFRPVHWRSWRAAFQPIQRAWPHRQRLYLPLGAFRSWRALALALLERAAVTGGVWHLWGHSWEIERYGMWDDLEYVLAAADHYTEARRVTNSELYMNRDNLL